MAREKVERDGGARESWRVSMSKESVDGEAGKRRGRAAPVGDCGPRGYVGWKRTRGTDVRGESDGGRDVPGRTEVI